MGKSDTGTKQNNDHADFINRIHEALFSLNIGFTCAFAMFGYAPKPIVMWLYRIDSSIGRFLMMREIDLAGNYMVFFILAIVFALCVWTTLYFFSRKKGIDVILRWFAGFVALAALPAMAISPVGNSGSLRKIIFPLEILSVLYFALRYLQGKWPQSKSAITAIMIAHFVFWSREFGPFEAIQTMLFHGQKFHAYTLLIPGGAPITWIVAFSSALAWVFYVRRTRQTLTTSEP